MPPLAEIEVIDASSLVHSLRELVFEDHREKSSILSAALHAAWTPRVNTPVTRPITTVYRIFTEQENEKL
jgi:hypothetical protein